MSINQEERCREKTAAHTINVQLLMASVVKSQVIDIKPVLLIMESRSGRSINHNVMLLQQFCHMSHFNRVLHLSAGHLRQPTSAKCWDAASKSYCYTALWCIVNHNTCFRLFLFFWH